MPLPLPVQAERPIPTSTEPAVAPAPTMAALVGDSPFALQRRAGDDPLPPVSSASMVVPERPVGMAAVAAVAQRAEASTVSLRPGGPVAVARSSTRFDPSVMTVARLSSSAHGERSAAAGPSVVPGAPTSTGALDAGSVAVASGIAQRSSDGSVVFGAVDGDVLAGDGPDHGSPDVQRAAVAPGAAPAAGAAGAPSPTELDELARRLYGRIRLHLRHELRLDRERAGSWVETRR
jgi:hypothetical protein